MRSLIVQSAAGQSEQERLQAELDKLRDELQAETEMSSEHKAALAEIQAAKELAVAELAEAQAAVADAATLQAAKLQEIEQAHKIEKQAALDAHDKERQSIIQSLQAKISEKESETERIERELQETTLKFQDAEQSAAALDALAPLEEQVAKLTEELRVAGTAKLDAENKVQRLQTDKRLAEEGIQRQSSSLDKHALALKMENTGLLEENSRLKAELDAAERSRVEREASHVRSRERTAELATEHADEVGVLKTEREAFEKQAVDAQAALDSASASHQAALQQAAEQAESARADLAKQLTEMDAELSAAQKILSKNTTELTALKEAHSAEVSSLRQKLESLAAASSAEEELRKQHSEAVAARAQVSDELARAIAARNDDAAAHAQELKDLQEAQASILETARQQAATQAEEAQLAFGQHEAAMRQEHEDTVAALRQECEKSATQAVERESKLLQVEQAVLALKQASAEWSDERADWVRKHSAEQVGCASARAQLSAAQQTIQDLQASKDEELAKLRQHMLDQVEAGKQSEQQMQTQAAQITAQAEKIAEHTDEVGVLKTEREAFEKQAVDAQAALDSASASHQAALQQAAEQAESARADLAKQLTEMDAELSAAQKILSKNTTELTALKEAHSAEVSSLRQKLESLAAASSAEEELRKQHSEAVAARAQVSDELARAIAARNDDAAAHAQELKDLQEAQASILETARQQAATQAEEAQLAFGQHEAAMRQEHEDTVAALRQECEKSATQAVERESKLLQVEQAVLALKQASAEWSDERADWVRKHSAEQVGCASARAQLSAAQQTIQDLQASKDEELAELREHMRQTVLESEQQTQTQMQTQAKKIAELEASLASLAADQAAEIEPAPTPLPVSHSIFQDKIAELEAANATQAARIGQLEATLADSQPEPEPAPTHQEASPPTPAVGAHKVAETCKTCGQLIGIGAETGGWLQQELNEKEREIEELRTQIRKNEADKEHEKLVQAERTKGNDIIGTGTTRREATARSGLSGRPGEGQEPPPPPAEQPVRNRPGAGGRAGSSGAAPHESITPPSTRGGPAASAPTDQHASGSRVALQKLEAMGFSGAAAEQALQASGGDLRAAVTRLTRG